MHSQRRRQRPGRLGVRERPPLEELELEARPPLPRCAIELRERLTAVRVPPTHRDLRDVDEKRRGYDRLERELGRIRRELDRELWPRTVPA